MLLLHGLLRSSSRVDLSASLRSTTASHRAPTRSTLLGQFPARNPILVNVNCAGLRAILQNGVQLLLMLR